MNTITNNIDFNKVYKYKDLQNLFNIYNKSGEQTIKEISKFYKIKKIKRGYYKIERPLDIIEQIEQNTYLKQRQYIEPMIYELLFSNNNNSVTMDMHELMEETEIVNKDFNYIKWHIKECSELINQDEVGLELFTKESEPMLKRIIRDVLYDMDDRQLIKVTEIPVIAYKIYDYETKTWFTKRQDIIKVQDVQKLLEIKRKILNDIGVEKESKLGYHERSNFRDLVAKEYEAEYFYYKYNIVLNKKGLKENLNHNILQLKKSFNLHIQDKLKKSKQGNLKKLTEEEKNIYIKYCIDTSQDFNLRNRKHLT